MPVDWAFKIPHPLPALKNCKTTVKTIPDRADAKAAVVDGRLENKPNNSGAVSETDMRE